MEMSIKGAEGWVGEGTQTTSFNLEPQHDNKTQRHRKCTAGKQGTGATH